MAEAIDLTDFYDRSLAFLTELSRNNDRGWFAANKTRYDAEIKRPAERLLVDLSPLLQEMGAAPVRTKLFRPHRDMRFSQDKTPYHTHLHLLWAHPDGRGWFFGLSSDYATAGAGIMQMADDSLARYRAAVDGPAGDALAARLADGKWRLDTPALKQVPRGYASDHRHAALLRRKGLVAWLDDLGPALRADPRGTLQDAFAALSPVQDWLRAHL